MGRIILPLYTPRYVPNGGEVAVIQTSRGCDPRAAGRHGRTGDRGELHRAGRARVLRRPSSSTPANRDPSWWEAARPRARSGPRRWRRRLAASSRGIHPGTGDARYTIVR